VSLPHSLDSGPSPLIPDVRFTDCHGLTHRDAKLLSFGIGGEDEASVSFKKKPIFRPDRKSPMSS